MLLFLLLSLFPLTQSRDTWKTQLSHQLCSTRDHVTLTGQRTLANSGFHKDLTIHLDLGSTPAAAFLLENITSSFYLDLDQIAEGLYLGYPPVFADAPIDVEQPADSSPNHLVGVLLQTHHVTLPVHHRYQPAGSEPYATVCLPAPRVFLPVVTPAAEFADLEAGMERVERERGCRLLRAPCTTTQIPECGWEEVRVEGLEEPVCSTVPVGLLQHLGLVKITCVAAILFGLSAIVYTALVKTNSKFESKYE